MTQTEAPASDSEKVLTSCATGFYSLFFSTLIGTNLVAAFFSFQTCNCLGASEKVVGSSVALAPTRQPPDGGAGLLSVRFPVQEDAYQHATVTLQLAPLLFYNMGLYLEPRSLVDRLHKNPPPPNAHLSLKPTHTHAHTERTQGLH